MTTATTLRPDLALPRLGTGPAAEGRKAALRSFYNHFNDLNANMLDDIGRVTNGTAPQAFKDAYLDTLHAMSALFDTTTPAAATAVQ